MFSLIITIIAIALVAALALATIYYGGSAFNKGAASANASKLLNQSQQILGADRLYRADHEGQMPPSMQALVDGGYLKSIPTASYDNKFTAHAATVAWEMVATSSGRGYQFTASSVDAESCKNVNLMSFGQNGILNSVFNGFKTQCYGPDTSNLTVLVLSDSTLFTTGTVASDLPSAPRFEAGSTPSAANWTVTPTAVSDGSGTGTGGTGGTGTGGAGTGGAGDGSGTGGTGGTVMDPGVIETDDGAVWLKYSTHYFLTDSGRVEFDVVSNYETPLTVTGISGSVGQDNIYLFSNRFPGYASIVCTGSPFNYNCHISAYLDAGYGQPVGATGTLTVNTNYGTLTAPALVVDYDPTRHQDGVLRNY